MELAALFELLDQAITRHPEEKKNFDALRHLVEHPIAGAAEKLNAVLLKVPLDTVSPAVGMDLVVLTKKKVELQATLQPALNRIIHSKGRISIAAGGPGTGGKK
jgi:hypothetical protein